MTRFTVFVGLLIPIVALGCSNDTSSDSAQVTPSGNGAPIATTASPTFPTPVATVGSPVNGSLPVATAPSAASGTSATQVTQAETDYINHYQQIVQMFTSAEKHFKGEGDTDSAQVRLQRAQADIDSAWQLEISFPKPPLRFAVADIYLTQALAKERQAFRNLSLGLNQESGTDAYVEAGEVLKKSMDEFQKQLEALGASSNK